MWNDDEEVNDNGEFVKLYMPAQSPSQYNSTSLSHIGGRSSFEEDAPSCAKCGQPMHLLVQLHLAKSCKSDGTLVDRTLCVFGCPLAKCFEELKFEKGFSSGGQGVMCCQSRETPAAEAKKPSPAPPVAPSKSSWYNDGDAEDDDDDDWGLDSKNTKDLSHLESAVAAMEQSLENGTISKPKSDEKFRPAKGRLSKESTGAFKCYTLKEQNEPIALQKVEEDDVGLTASDEKIRNMLARYMAEEEDEYILAALRGTNIGGGAGEEDERLSAPERILLGFQDRLRRAPRQVVRYARGGVPLWSIVSEKKGKPLWTVPPCACGAKPSFEFQLLPSLLHVLEVDRYAGSKASGGSAAIGDMLSNGMNWGSVAVFTCPDSCGEEALVIQESVDERPDLPAGQHVLTATMAVVEDMDDDDEFKPDA